MRQRVRQLVTVNWWRRSKAVGRERLGQCGRGAWHGPRWVQADTPVTKALRVVVVERQNLARGVCVLSAEGDLSNGAPPALAIFGAEVLILFFVIGTGAPSGALGAW